MLGNADGGVWTLTSDRPAASGLSYPRPEVDNMTLLRRELLQELIGEDLGTHIEVTSSGIVDVPTLDGPFAQIRAQDVAATEWLRKLREGMLQSGARDAAGAALTSIAVGDVEAWKAASRRLVLVYQGVYGRPGPPSHLGSSVRLEVPQGLSLIHI